jgi:hypothetical protein
MSPVVSSVLRDGKGVAVLVIAVSIVEPVDFTHVIRDAMQSFSVKN